MRLRELRSYGILTTCAAIWGFAFVAQRMSIGHVPSFAFNGIRFLLGAVSLLPVICIFSAKSGLRDAIRRSAKPGLLIGVILFIAASLQQLGMDSAFLSRFGMQGAGAGKAGFITGLYLVIVPVVGIFFGHRSHALSWFGAAFSLAGLYLISVRGDFTFDGGDVLIFIGAIFWSMHILFVDRYAAKADALLLSLFQFVSCASLSLLTSAFFEHVTLSGVQSALAPILYGGFASVGVAYTLQIIGQRYAKPARSAIILSMESCFAALGGFLILGENMGLRGYIGCALMIAGMLFAQLPSLRERRSEPAAPAEEAHDAPDALPSSACAAISENAEEPPLAATAEVE